MADLATTPRSNQNTEQMIAEAAYDAYSRTAGGKDYHGQDLTPYAALPDYIRAAWADAVLAVIGGPTTIQPPPPAEVPEEGEVATEEEPEEPVVPPEEPPQEPEATAEPPPYEPIPPEEEPI